MAKTTTLTIDMTKLKKSYSLKGMTKIILNGAQNEDLNDLVSSVTASGSNLILTLNDEKQTKITLSNALDLANISLTIGETEYFAGEMADILLAKISAITSPQKGTTVTGSSFDDEINVSEYAVQTEGKNAWKGLTINGNKGNDSITGTDGNDVITGGDGADTIQGGLKNDKISGGKGTDIFLFTTNDGVDTITDATDEDTIEITGQKANETDLTFDDLRFAQNKNNLEIYYSDEFDENNKIVIQNYYGKSKNPKIDKIVVNGAEESISDLIEENRTISGKGSINGSKEGNDGIIGSGTNDTIKVTKGNNIINAKGGNDKITGGEGADTITGGLGNDTITGGNGNDIFIFSAGDGADVINDAKLEDEIDITNIRVSDVKFMRTGNNLIIGFKDNDSDRITINNYFKSNTTPIDKIYLLNDLDERTEYSLAEQIAEKGYSLSGKGTINGTDESELIDGSEFADKINGKGGDDTINGGEGNDVINGDTGNDSISGGSGNDTITGGVGNDTITGGLGNDKIYGTDGDNTIFFNEGDGVDTVYSGLGKDTLVLNNYPDLNTLYNNLSLFREGTSLKIKYSDNDAVILNDYFKSIEKEEYYSVKKIVVADGSYVNLKTLISELPVLTKVITGTNGDDTINGGDEDDVIRSGGGHDVINGGQGNDVIYLDQGNEGTIIKYNWASGTCVLEGGLDQIFNSSSKDTLYINIGNAPVTIDFQRCVDDLVIGLWSGENVNTQSAEEENKIILRNYYSKLPLERLDNIIIHNNSANNANYELGDNVFSLRELLENYENDYQYKNEMHLGTILYGTNKNDVLDFRITKPAYGNAEDVGSIHPYGGDDTINITHNYNRRECVLITHAITQPWYSKIENKYTERGCNNNTIYGAINTDILQIGLHHHPVTFGHERIGADLVLEIFDGVIDDFTGVTPLSTITIADFYNLPEESRLGKVYLYNTDEETLNEMDRRSGYYRIDSWLGLSKENTTDSVINGTEGNDIIDGYLRSDIINGNGGSDTITGGRGDDIINLSQTGDGSRINYYFAKNDVLQRNGHDQILHSTNKDTLYINLGSVETTIVCKQDNDDLIIGIWNGKYVNTTGLQPDGSVTIKGYYAQNPGDRLNNLIIHNDSETREGYEVGDNEISLVNFVTDNYYVANNTINYLWDRYCAREEKVNEVFYNATKNDTLYIDLGNTPTTTEFHQKGDDLVIEFWAEENVQNIQEAPNFDGIIYIPHDGSITLKNYYAMPESERINNVIIHNTDANRDKYAVGDNECLLTDIMDDYANTYNIVEKTTPYQIAFYGTTRNDIFRVDNSVVYGCDGDDVIYINHAKDSSSAVIDFSAYNDEFNIGNNTIYGAGQKDSLYMILNKVLVNPTYTQVNSDLVLEFYHEKDTARTKPVGSITIADYYSSPVEKRLGFVTYLRTGRQTQSHRPFAEWLAMLERYDHENYIIGADSITGTAFDDVITCTGLNDTIKGGRGNDIIYLNKSGSSRVNYYWATDEVLGRNGHDTILDSTNNDILYIDLGSVNETIKCSRDNDDLIIKIWRDGIENTDYFDPDGSIKIKRYYTVNPEERLDNLIIHNLMENREGYIVGDNFISLAEFSVVHDDGSIEHYDENYNVINGTVIDDELYGTTGKDIINGNGGNDYIFPKKGDDIINITHTPNLQEGSTIYFEIGYDMDEYLVMAGHNTINGANNLDTVEIELNGYPVTMRYARTGNDLVLRFYEGAVSDTSALNPISSITFTDYYITPAAERIDNIVFNHYGQDHMQDLISINSLSQLIQTIDNSYYNILNGTENDDILTGKTDESSLITGLAGNDSITGSTCDDTITGGTGNDTINGGTGFNTYLFDIGDGQDTIINAGGNNDEIIFNTSVSVKCTRNMSNNDLLISYGNDDSITLKDYFVNNSHSVEVLTNTTNPTPWLEDIVARGMTILGTNNSETITGTAGADVIKSNGGNDTITASHMDTIYGGSGNSTFIFQKGDGGIIISGTGEDTLEISGQTLDDLEYYYNEDNNNLLIHNNYDNIILENYFDNHSVKYLKLGENTYTLEEAVDSKGIDYSYNVNWHETNNITGTPYRDNIDGGFMSDILNGGAGNDVITGNLGDDTISGGDGNDIIFGRGGLTVSGMGGSDNDVLYGNAGNDTIDGGAGNNELYGGTGDDTYVVGTDLSELDTIFDEAGSNDIISITNVNKSDLVLRFDLQVDNEGNILDDLSKNMYITSTADFGNTEIGIKVTDQFVEGNSIEAITTADGYSLTTTQINQLRENLSGWLHTNGFESVQQILDSENETDINNLIAQLQTADWQQI